MAMSEIGRRHSPAGSRSAAGRIAASPLAWIMAFTVIAVAGLILPLRLPLGPNAWDTVVYLDAIQRIGLGQVPSIDFFAPVGPLGFYLAAALDAVFPHAQPMLLINWALLPIMLPVLALIAGEVELDVGGLAVAALHPGRGDQITPEVLDVLDVAGVLFEFADQRVVVLVCTISQRLVAGEHDHRDAVRAGLLEFRSHLLGRDDRGRVLR